MDPKMRLFRSAFGELGEQSLTALGQEQEIGVNWKRNRGRRSRQALTFGCSWARGLSRMT